jgi:hypothetical protein
MNMRTIIIAMSSLIGTQYLGYSILYGLIAFNLVIWADIVYNIVFSTNSKVKEDISTKIQIKPENEAQVAFERWIIKKYVELTKNEAEPPIEEIPFYFSDNLTPVEA